MSAVHFLELAKLIMEIHVKFPHDTLLSRTDTNEIPTVPPHLDLIQNRPFAQLIG